MTKKRRISLLDQNSDRSLLTDSFKKQAAEQIYAGKPLTGKNGIFGGMIKDILETALSEEMNQHLRSQNHQDGRGYGDDDYDGNEQCGKSKLFSRPILISKKFNNHFFFGIPLSSIQKDNKYYFNFEFKGKEQSAIICQAKPVSTKRLSTKIGEIEKELLNKIRKESAKILFNLS